MSSHRYLGNLPSDWRTVQLDAVVERERPIVYGIVQAGPHIPDGVPYIKSTDVGGHIILASLSRTTSEIHRRYKRAEVRPGDLVFSLRGDIGQSSIVPDSIPLANLTQGTARISTSNEFDVEFVRYVLSAPALVKRIASIAKGSSFREISLEQLRELEIPAPKLSEQRLIAKILRTWDEAIEHNEKLTVLSEVRLRGVQQRLFNKTAIKENNWEIKPLAQVAERVSRKSDGTPHPVMTISGKAGFLRQDEKFKRFMAGESVKNYTLLQRGEFAYNKGNSKTYPQGCIYRLEQETALVPHVYISFQLNTGLNSDFYVHLFQSGFLNRQLARLINSGVRNDGLLNLNIEDFFGCWVPVPPEDQQARNRRLSGSGQARDDYY